MPDLHVIVSIANIAAEVLIRPLRALWRRAVRGPAARFFSHAHESGIVVVLSSVRAIPEDDKIDPVYGREFAYFHGQDEVDFLEAIRANLYKLVPSEKHLQVVSSAHAFGTDGSLREDVAASNLLLFGGPIFNEVTATLYHQGNVPVSYTFEQQTGRVMHSGSPVSPEVPAVITEDHGLIQKVCSPWDPSKTIFVVAGRLHYFQEGLAKVFRDRRTLKRFHRALKAKLRKSSPLRWWPPRTWGSALRSRWEAYCRCEVVGGRPSIRIEILDAQVLSEQRDGPRLSAAGLTRA